MGKDLKGKELLTEVKPIHCQKIFSGMYLDILLQPDV